MHLLYIADPLCSWCYGFGPELSKLMAKHPGAQLELVMGGLRPFNREPMSDAFRNMLREHWRHVAEASGLAFSDANLERPGFVYDTEPACRAVATARRLHPASAFGYFKAVQAAFYRDGRDATQGDLLAEIAAENGYDREAFLERFESEAARKETLGDFASTQALGVNGFPTLGAKLGKQVYLVTSGFVTGDVLEERLAQIEQRAS
jgi:putative protein-disulfide isomerase